MHRKPAWSFALHEERSTCLVHSPLQVPELPVVLVVAKLAARGLPVLAHLLVVPPGSRNAARTALGLLAGPL